MLTIRKLRVNSNKFIQNLDKHIREIVDFNERLEQLNKNQLKNSMLSTGAPIEPPYSNPYRDWKSRNFPESIGDGRPNLFLTGKLYNNMDIRIKTSGRFEISSTVPYILRLSRKYTDKIFGISPDNQPIAKSITTQMLSEIWQREVLKG